MDKGFTLIEILVVISIIGILATVVLASLNSARENAVIAAGLSFEDQAHKKLYDCLQGEYTFENTTNLEMDSSGYGNTATSNSISSADGINGGLGIQFDSSNDYLVIPNMDNKQTYSMWAYLPEDTVRNSYLADFRPSANGRFIINTTSYPSEHVWAQQYINGVQVEDVVWENLPKDKWFHILVVETTNNHSGTITIGNRYRYGRGLRSNGAIKPKIDNLRIYNCAL